MVPGGGGVRPLVRLGVTRHVPGRRRGHQPENSHERISRQTDRQAPLWSPAFEHDSCGVGLVVDIAGRPSREIVERALAGLVNLTHRGGVGADSRTGDGAGVLTPASGRPLRRDAGGRGSSPMLVPASSAWR